MRVTTPNSSEELQSALDTLLVKAYQNGVPVSERAFAIDHTGAEIPSWEVLITRVVES